MYDIEELYRKLKDQVKVPNRRLKGRIHSASFSQYLFGERKKIDRWNRSVHLVKFGFFGLTTKTKRDFGANMYDLFLRTALPLYKTAEKTLEEGWKWHQLSVREYNIIVYYVDFCKKMLTGEIREWSDQWFAMVEEAYLKLVCETVLTRLLETGLGKIISGRFKSGSAGLDAARASLRKLMIFLATDGRHPSFLDYVLAHNMVESRRCLVFDDIVAPSRGPALPEKFYNCSIDVFRSIVAYHRELDGEIKRLRIRLNWLEWLDRQSQCGEGEEPVEIMEFYGSASTDWRVDGKSFYALALTLVKQVIDQLEGIVRKDWELMTAEEKIIRARLVHDESLEKLLEDLANEHAAGEAYNRIASPATFSLADFLGDSVNEALAATKVHKELKEKFESMLSLLFRIAVTFEEISVDRYSPGSFLLRHMIVRPIQYRGKSVMDLIAGQTGLLLQICRYFRSGELGKELSALSKVRGQLSAKQKEMNHIDVGRIIEGLMADIGHDRILAGG